MMTSHAAAEQRSAMNGYPAAPAAARRLALGAVVGPILFTLAWLILGFVSPGFTIFGTEVAPYSAVSTPISGLGLGPGPTAPFMNGAFILGGLLLLAGVVGVFRSIPELGAGARWSGTILLGLTGVGMVLEGLFTLESFMLHMAGFVLGTASPVVGFLLTGLQLRRIPRWRRFGTWLLLASPLTLVLVVLSLTTFNQEAVVTGRGVAGLVQRILLVELMAWFVIMGWLAARRA